MTIDDEAVVVQAAGKRITVSAGALPAPRPLLSGHPVNLQALATHTGLEVTDVVVLAKALVSSGLCAEMTPATTAGFNGMISSERLLDWGIAA